jgi:hypothetical protein
LTSPNATTGSTRTWSTSAAATAFGDRATRRKSFTVRDNPRPNMMIARAIGSPTAISAESSTRSVNHWPDSQRPRLRYVVSPLAPGLRSENRRRRPTSRAVAARH